MTRAPLTEEPCVAKVTSTVLKASGGGDPFAELNQALKRVIRGRKNALFFKTSAGAAIADVITSVVATAYQAGINVFEYLIVLQRHAEAVKAQPECWLPWNYQTTLEAEKEAA